MHSLRLKRSVEKCKTPPHLVLVGVEYTCGHNEMKVVVFFFLNRCRYHREEINGCFPLFSASADSFLTGFPVKAIIRP